MSGLPHPSHHPVPWAAPAGLRPRPAATAPRLEPLRQALTALDSVDVENTPPSLLADEVVAIFRCVDQLHSLALQRLARVDAHGLAAHAFGSSTASWLRHHTGLASGAASDLVRTARDLRDLLPETARALGAGEVTVQHARTIARTARLVQDRSDDSDAGAAVADVEHVMVDVAKAVDAASLVGFAKRIRQVADPDGALRDAERAHERRWLSASKTLDGMVALDGLLDPEAGAVVLTALSAASVPRGPDDHRNAGQRRADGLVDICGVSLDHAALGWVGGVRPHLLVTVPLPALTRDAPNGEPASLAEVGEVAWTGPLLDQTLRRLGCDANVRRVLVDPESLPLDVGRSTRTVPLHLRQALAVRDRGCVAEGCDRPVAWTEAHHVVHWAEGGATSLDNLVLLCRSHHRCVHEGDWQFEQVGGAWRLVPPSAAPRPPRRSDAATDQAADQVGDSGRRGTERELPKPREEPRPDRDP